MIKTPDMKSRSNDRSDSARVIPQGYTDQVLMDLLAEIQQDTRRIKQEFNIETSGICAMARAADERISDTALRSTFLHLLIDLHEFGREAGRRGLLERASGKSTVEAADLGDEDEALRRVAASDVALGGVSRAFFGSLDSPCESSR